MSSNSSHKGNFQPAVNYWKIIITFSVTVAIVIGCIILTVVKMDKKEVKNKTKVEESQGIYASGYLPSYKAPDPVDAKVITPVEPNVIEGEKEPPLVERKEYKTKKTELKPRPAPTPTPEELLLKARIERMRALEAKRKALILARRTQKAPEWQQSETIARIEGEKRKKAALKSPTDKDFSDHDLEKDISTFPVDLSRTITEGRFIPCATKGEINSQIEGSVTCVVKSNVYGFHGRNILIPAGTEAHGEHGSLKKVGDERFSIIWHRLIRPDGVNIMLTDAGTSDRIGATGVQGDVNKRFGEKYGAALLTSSISAVAQASIPMEGSNNTRVALESYGTDIGRVSAAMIQDTINIKPFAKLPAGSVINIRPTTDIWLKNIDKKAMFSRVNEEQK